MLWNAVIGKYNTNELGLRCFDFQLSSANARKNNIIIPGRDGVIRTGKMLAGRTIYDNRILTMSFTHRIKDLSDHLNLHSKLNILFSGQVLPIRTSSMPNYYLLGEIIVTPEYSTENPKESVHVFTVDCDPYWYKNTQTTATVTASAAGTLKVFNNLFAPSRPTFTISQAGVEIKQGNTQYSVPVGTVSIPEIVFAAGDNPLVFYGSGNVTINWQEGTL